MQGWLRLKAASEATGADITGHYTGSTAEVVPDLMGRGAHHSPHPPHLQRFIGPLHWFLRHSCMTRQGAAEAAEGHILIRKDREDPDLKPVPKQGCGQPLLAVAQPVSQKQTGTSVGGQNAAACTLLQAKSLCRPFTLQYGSLWDKSASAGKEENTHLKGTETDWILPSKPLGIWFHPGRAQWLRAEVGSTGPHT